MNRNVSVLFARKDSCYKQLCADVWDVDRDATCYKGKNPVVAHPPCRLFGRMRQFSKANETEKELAYFAVDKVREVSGVLEHPAYSTLWKEKQLPKPGEYDSFGGWTLSIQQHDFGHLAQKSTWLYIIGCSPREIPDIPISLDYPTHCIRPSKNSLKQQKIVSKALREHTPIALAKYLLRLAEKTRNKL